MGMIGRYKTPNTSASGLLQAIIRWQNSPTTRSRLVGPSTFETRRRVTTSTKQPDQTSPVTRTSLASFANTFEQRDAHNGDSALRGPADTSSSEAIASRRPRLPSAEDEERESGDDLHVEISAAAWRDRLEKESRLRGLDGVLAVWFDMRKAGFVLPVEGSDADSMWTQLLNASITETQSSVQIKILESVLAHAQTLATKYNLRWPGLYSCIIGRWLRLCPEHAAEWHSRLTALLSFSRVDLRPLANACAFSRDPLLALESFRVVHAAFPGQNLYDVFILELLNYNHRQEVIEAWHHYFIACDDGPSPETAALPEVKRLTDLSFKQMAEDMTEGHDEAEPSPVITPFTRASMSTVVGDVHGIKAKEISDGFVAKLLATKAFSLDIVLAGLSFFSVSKLGPLALRELAQRTTSLLDFKARIHDLEQKDIRPDNSVYGAVIRYLSDNDFDSLFEALLARDQHPDDLEDIHIQSSLLYAYLQQEEMENAHLTLIILSMIDSRGHDKAWNIMLQYYAKNGDRKNVESVARRMRTAAIPANRRSLTFLHRYVLTARSPSKRPMVLAADETSRYFSSLDFTTIMYIHAAKHGTEVHPQLWVENLKRYGMLGDWNNVERLILWLYAWYSPQDQAAGDAMNPFARESDSATLRTIFSTPMLTALVVWGMRAPSARRIRLRPWNRLEKARRVIGPLRTRQLQIASPSESVNTGNALEVLPWARGIALLHQIETKYSVPLAHQTAYALIKRLWILFGPAYSHRQRNIEAIAQNQTPIVEYLQHANDIWGGKLYDLDTQQLENDPEKWSAFLISLFGSRRSTRSTTGEFADVQAWAADIARGHRMSLGRTVAENARLWRRSPYRIAPP